MRRIRNKKAAFLNGMQDGIPIALGYFAVSFSLGIAARNVGLSPAQGFLASALCNASAGEYALFTLIGANAAYWEVALVTLITNARYFLMSCALSQRFSPSTPFFHRLLIGNYITDEFFGIAVAREGSRGSVNVLRFSDSRLYDTENFIINDVDDEVDFRSQFILRYYTLRSEIPAHIALDGEIEDLENTELWLTDKKGKRVYINIPQRGVQKNLVDMCQKNAYEALGQLKGVTGKQLSVLDELKNLLGLDRLPEYIESYDISNLAGADNVAGMVVFENARPLKSAYRKFKIKSFSGQDDFGSMAEVLTRRLDEYKKAQEEGVETGFGRLPDLILLDGGKGQVSAVLPVVAASGLNIPVFGMVKDDHHRTRAIVSDTGEIAIRPNRAVFTFVTNIQDEVHRYAITFNRSQRKRVLGSSLEEIPGIGKKRAKELMRFFRTIKKISTASVEELEQAPGMTHPAALSVYNYFHEEA